ncbi:MAG: terminase large subunit domain-containing protein [bacterium]
MDKDIKKTLDDLGLDLRKEKDRKYFQFFRFKYNKHGFIERYVNIEDKDKKEVVIPFKLWEAQKELLDLFINEDRVVTLKARQLGITWLALADTAHDLLYNPGFAANTISQTEGDVKELVRRMGFIFKYMPNWLIVDKKAEKEEKNENITGLVYEQHKLKLIVHHPGKKEPAVFKGFTSSPGAARSFTANKVIMDEWAFHPFAEDIWEAAYPTINRATGGKVIGISTADKGTLHEDIWQNATWEFKGEKGNGSNSFVGMFIPWYAHPGRDQEWYDKTAADIPNSVKKEYPASPAEAFSAGAGAMFHEWQPNIHIPYGQGWYPPGNWRIILAYDGGYNRAAAGWFAISPDGWSIMYREYYPAHKIDPEQMEDIRMLSRDPDGVPEQIDYIVADTSCWAKNKDTGKTTVEIGEDKGLRPWRQADKDRIMGWRRVHEFLTPLKDEEKNYILDRNGDPLAKLRFTQSCSNTIRIFPGLKVHPQKPDDLDNGQEDHLHDMIRYYCQSRPKPNINQKTRKEIEKARKRRIKPISSSTGY